MNVLRIASWGVIAALLAISFTAAFKHAAALQHQEGIEVLTRAPVHEAFAEIVSFDPQPGFIAPKAPPPPIEEIPPQQGPEGVNVAWISGYFAWDKEPQNSPQGKPNGEAKVKPNCEAKNEPN